MYMTLIVIGAAHWTKPAAQISPNFELKPGAACEARIGEIGLCGSLGNVGINAVSIGLRYRKTAIERLHSI